MLTWMLCCAVVATNGNNAPASATDWLPAGHPRISVKFDSSEKEDCRSDCDRLALLLTYRSSVPATAAEVREWNQFAHAGCFDIVAAGRKSFACRVPGSMSWESKTGQRQATSRFHVRREQLMQLEESAGELQLDTWRLRFPDDTRAALRRFLDPAPQRSR